MSHSVQSGAPKESKISFYLIAVLFTLLLSPVMHAQDKGGSASDLGRFSAERLTLTNSAGSSQFRLSAKHILIQFKDGIPENQQAALLAGDPSLEPVTAEMLLPAPRAVLGTLREGLSEQEVVELLNRISAMSEVRYANPFLEYRDGALMGIQDRFHVKLRSLTELPLLQGMAREQGAAVLGSFSFAPLVYIVTVDKQSKGNAFELARLFQESRSFEWAEPDFFRLLQRVSTNDTYNSYQWALNNTGSALQYNGTPGADMEVFNAWNLTTGSAAVKVAIIDEGTDLNHPDLIANLLPGYDATGLGSNGGPQNNDAHGTNCAGIVGAVGNNNLGIAGVAYGCKIVPVRIAYSSGPYWMTSDAVIADAINWAWNQGAADVLSNSWGGGSPAAIINLAIDNAINFGRSGRGASVLFSAGNGNSTTVIYPANYNQTIAIAASSMCDQRKSPSSCDGEYWWGSDYGTNVDVAAPGVKIYSTDISGPAGYSSGDYYPTFNGTSSACPNAAGVMALIYSMNPLLTHAQARVILETTTEKVGGYTYTNNVAGQPNGSWCTNLGYGRVNAYNAVLAAQNSLCQTDIIAPKITAPANLVLPNTPGLCSVNASLVNLGTPIVTDNCPNNLTVSNNAPAVFPRGLTIVTWTVVDGGNNLATATQSVTVIDVDNPVISGCAANQTVEGSAQNTAVLPDLRNQIIASDNCTASPLLVIVQTPSPGTTVGTGTTVVNFAIADERGNQAFCSSTFTVVPRTQIDPAASFVVISGGCKTPVIVTRSVSIDNSGGNFGGGQMRWTATTSASEITLVTSSGYEGDNLVFTVDPRFLPTGTVNRTITLTAWNSVTNVPASNSPFSMTISLQIEPLGTVSVTQPVGLGWTVFTNSSGQKIAEVKSNAGSISSFTVNMYPCTVPQGLARIRYVQRYYTMSSNAGSPNVDVRLFYTNTEAQGLITQPAALTVWQKPWNVWTNRGGSSQPFENHVQANGLTNLSGPFAIAHNWFPKEGVDAEDAVPESISLAQNYPNPFNPTTVIRYTLPEAATVRLVVHDLFGREIAVLDHARRSAGTHEVEFNGQGLPSGTYICTLEANGKQLRRSMLLMK
ncbi:MAG: S8 family serine peptidase [Bacteroidota bacterium]